VILNYCRGFKPEKQNKTAGGIWKYNSGSLFGNAVLIIDVGEKIWSHTSKFQNFLTCIFLGAKLGVMDQFRGLRFHPILRRLISSCVDTLKTLFTRTLWPPSMNWSSELLQQSKDLHRKCWRTLGGKLNTAWTTYVLWKARMLKLFSILQYWFYR
jgi:hypothetical protein